MNQESQPHPMPSSDVQAHMQMEHSYTKINLKKEKESQPASSSPSAQLALKNSDPLVGALDSSKAISSLAYGPCSELQRVPGSTQHPSQSKLPVFMRCP